MGQSTVTSEKLVIQGWVPIISRDFKRMNKLQLRDSSMKSFPEDAKRICANEGRLLLLR